MGKKSCNLDFNNDDFGFFGIAKCNHCGEYARFFILDEKKGKGLSDIEGTEENCLLVCSHCGMSYYLGNERMLNGIEKNKGSLIKAPDEDSVAYIWDYLKYRLQEFKAEKASPSEEEAEEFLTCCFDEVRFLFSADKDYCNIFSSFFDFFCEECGIESEKDYNEAFTGCNITDERKMPESYPKTIHIH